MYQKMLVPLDGSELAECSLEEAKIVAIACQCPEVILLRVIEPDPQVTDIGGLSSESWYRNAQDKIQTEVKKYITNVADRLKKEGLKAKGVVITGSAADEILDYASKNKVDIIVMSTHGRSGVSRWVVGSVADKIIRHAPMPVLIVAPTACRIP
jgi:nucleotide-binding universal stress UspA family protein